MIGPLTDAGPVLIVDDSESDVIVATGCYRRSKLDRELVVLTSGKELLDHLDGVLAGEREMPAVVLLDINMPGIDGFETLERIRSRPQFVNVPVILMLTNSDSPRDVERAKECGADGFQVKPLRMRDYVAFFDSLAG